MQIDINDDPSLLDWDGDTELTPWQQMRARICMDWARVASNRDGQHSAEVLERAARQQRLRMTRRERAEDDRAWTRTADLARAPQARGTREYLRDQGWMYGLSNPNPTRAEIMAAQRVRAARCLVKDKQAERRDLYREDHDGFDPDELFDAEAVAVARSVIDGACDLLERHLAERPMTYAEIIATDPEYQKELMTRDGMRLCHVLVVGGDGVRPDAETRMPAAKIANPPRNPLYAGVRCRSDVPTLGDMLWPTPERQVQRLRETVAQITGSPCSDDQ